MPTGAEALKTGWFHYLPEGCGNLRHGRRVIRCDTLFICRDPDRIHGAFHSQVARMTIYRFGKVEVRVCEDRVKTGEELERLLDSLKMKRLCMEQQPIQKD